MKKHRAITPFNLSFLDIMFCGFGAVVLLVLILDSQSVQQRERRQQDLRAEALRIELQVLEAERNLASARNSLQQTDDAVESTRGRVGQVISRLEQRSLALSRFERETLALNEHLNRLKSDLQDLDQENARLGAEFEETRDQGSKARRFSGEGDRQYLTGLKMAGKRVLILVDASSSMLHESLVNIIRVRNMDPAVQRSAAKWQRTLASVEWLAANLPAASQFQIHAFNTRSESLVPGSERQWLAVSDRTSLDGAIAQLRQRQPQGGTSLYWAFAAAAALQPKPDNIFLVTDGLPTQGREKPSRDTVSARQRLAHFRSALDQLPKAVPVNTILLPMEGDAHAAAAFWQLAVSSRGALITPSRDWP